ncbi:hypothetical protein C9F11_06200 [Streptomyces sp. YIM 121038]|uniref:hypothetical protein n=1 Tax=Streptomyces sp. YIM 121038 TaxID=2136401 RepID=UPI00111017B3|nr:hypothetical protein [Streptomyces sp. YIM 121038]QCX74940.1 hypothetical protein C9F11_06200 [Streptomyces sp. YIM 121038]
MSEDLRLDDLAVALRVLRLLAVDFGHLAAPDVQVSPIFPERLRLSFHDDLPGFEAWREALGIAPQDVNGHVQSGGRTRVLQASATLADAELELIGFGKVPAPASAGCVA